MFILYEWEYFAVHLITLQLSSSFNTTTEKWRKYIHERELYTLILFCRFRSDGCKAGLNLESLLLMLLLMLQVARLLASSKSAGWTRCWQASRCSSKEPRDKKLTPDWGDLNTYTWSSGSETTLSEPDRGELLRDVSKGKVACKIIPYSHLLSNSGHHCWEAQCRQLAFYQVLARTVHIHHISPYVWLFPS